MDSGPSREALEATFNELSHLLVIPARLTLEDAELGVGGFGEVCLGTLDKSSQSPKKVAVKELRIVQASVARQRIAFRLARELKIWTKVKHPNILELIGYYLSENYVCAQLVSPFMVNGNVMQYIQRSRASVAVRLKFVRDIVAGLRYLHDLSPPICHGDLKPANVLVNENLDAVLCDFGVSSFIHEAGAASGLTTSKSTKGSTRYMSPELLLEEGSKHTLQSDVWAWGCTAFEVMTESIPYATRTKDTAVVLEIYRKSPPGPIDALGDLILGTGLDPACHTGLSSLRSIIPQCWDFDSKRRPSLASISSCIDIPARMEPRLGIREEPEAAPPRPPPGNLCMIMNCNGTEFAPGSKYCSNTCRKAAVEQGLEVACLMCKEFPKDPQREFCGKTCSDKAERNAHILLDVPTRISSDSMQGTGFETVPLVDTRSSGSRPAADCLMCRSVPKMHGSQFCSDSCKKQAHSVAPLLLEVYSWDPKFNDIAKQFSTTWKEESRVPPVIKIYKVVNPKKVEDAYEDYKKGVERQGKFASRGMAPGNENRRWHGTERKCNIGDSQDNLTPCNLPGCCVCAILRTSFDAKLSTARRFEKGIYTTATSSSSNEYVGRSPPGSNYRAMFLNWVVVGDAFILNKPQEGFNSVSNEVAHFSRSRTRKIRITVVAADGLCKRDAFRLPDPFAVITVDAEQTHSTSVIKRTLNPYWNENFDITVKDSSVIAVQIFDQRKFNIRDQGFLGVVNIRVAEVVDLELGRHEMLTLELQKSTYNLPVQGKVIVYLSTNTSAPMTNPGPSQQSATNPLSGLSALQLNESSISLNPNQNEGPSAPQCTRSDCPPQVIANANQSEGLAHDELVVYNNEAIKASWLVIYG